MTEQYDDESKNTTNQQTAQLYVKYSPTKVGYKGMKWKAKNSKIVYVSPYGVVTPVKAGSTKIYGYTKDGTNKKVTINVKINPAPVTDTPTPNYENDPREATLIESFESYQDGQNWARSTKGKEYVNSNCGDMMVVKDPENPNNKVLRIRYNGNTQAYDYAPIFSLDLGAKKLENYSAVRIKSRVVANAPDCTYKAVYGYFAKKGTIKSEHYFATSTKLADAEAKAKDKSNALFGTSSDELKDLLKFGVDIPMLEGTKEEYNAKSGDSAGKKYMNKYFPQYFSKYQEGDKTAVAAGYKETETGKVGFQTNTLEMQTSRIKEADASLLQDSSFDLALGSTYAGKYPNGQYVTVYIDDIEFLEGDIPIKSLNLQPKYTDKIVEGMYVDITKVLDPVNTTFSEVTWKSSNPEIATVDSNGRVTGIKAGKVNITATCVRDTSVSKTIEITVMPRGTAATKNKYLDLSGYTNKTPEKNATEEELAHGSDIQATEAEEGINLPFTVSDKESVIIKLKEPIDLTQYQGVAFTGLSDYQLTVEFHDASFDKRYSESSDNTNGDQFKAYNWWDRYQWATYPFFGGSCIGRAQDGTPTTNIGVETNYFNWDGSNDTSVYVRGSMTNVQYIVLKVAPGQTPAGKRCNLQYIQLLKDKVDKKFENPS